MVSRQETARPLLTPGEVMQLPPEDAVVMVSSVAPIRAKKLRYYVDANFRIASSHRPCSQSGGTPTRRQPAPTTGAAAIPAVPTAPTSVSADGRAAPMTAARAASSNSPKPSPTAELDACANVWSCSMTTYSAPASRPARPGHAAHGPAGFSRPQRRNRPMSQYRLNLFIQPEHAKRLDELAAKKGVSKSSIVAAALASCCHPMRATSVRPPLPSGWIDCRGRPNAWSATRTSRSKRWRCSSAIS